MLRRFRNMNMDYQMVGFYQSAAFGSPFSDEFLQSQLEYQVRHTLPPLPSPNSTL